MTDLEKILEAGETLRQQLHALNPTTPRDQVDKIFNLALLDMIEARFVLKDDQKIKQAQKQCVDALMDYTKLMADTINPASMDVLDHTTGKQTTLHGAFFNLPLCVIDVMGPLTDGIKHRHRKGQHVAVFIPTKGQEHLVDGAVYKEWPLVIADENTFNVPAGLMAETILMKMMLDSDNFFDESQHMHNLEDVREPSPLDDVRLHSGAMTPTEVEKMFEEAFGAKELVAMDPKSKTVH